MSKPKIMCNGTNNYNIENLRILYYIDKYLWTAHGFLQCQYFCFIGILNYKPVTNDNCLHHLVDATAVGHFVSPTQ